jgi:mercuric ion binding protein
MKKIVALVTLAAMTSPLWAATQTVTLSVPDMNCAACPITVKKALTKVSGVSKTDVNLDRREAKVTFDDVKTSVEALTRATKNAGYPSTVVGTAK